MFVFLFVVFLFGQLFYKQPDVIGSHEGVTCFVMVITFLMKLNWIEVKCARKLTQVFHHFAGSTQTDRPSIFVISSLMFWIRRFWIKYRTVVPSKGLSNQEKSILFLHVDLRGVSPSARLYASSRDKTFKYLAVFDPELTFTFNIYFTVIHRRTRHSSFWNSSN